MSDRIGELIASRVRVQNAALAWADTPSDDTRDALFAACLASRAIEFNLTEYICACGRAATVRAGTVHRICGCTGIVTAKCKADMIIMSGVAANG